MSSGGGIIRSGLHKPLEDAANEILRVHLAGITRHSEKADILTPWKDQDRRRREVYVTGGTPDASLRRGIFTREANLQHGHLNSVQGQIPAKFSGASSQWDRE